jgi:Uma2 family endonuclease
MTSGTTLPQDYTVTWEKLPADFILPDDPVENINQPLLAAALSEALGLAQRLTPTMLVASNMALCAKVNKRTIVKAPDWFYVPRVFPIEEGTVRRSYTPHTEGDLPTLVMEFLSETDTGEYSIRPTYPYGKMWFYERILQVPLYVIFDAASGMLEVRRLIEKRYEVQKPDVWGRYLIPELDLSLGVWQGRRLETTTHWLRWWDREGNLLLWGSEWIEQERQRAEQERQRAEQERQRAEQERQRAEAAEREVMQLRQLLRDAGLSGGEDGETRSH